MLPNSLRRFLSVFLSVFLLLALPWPGMYAAYRALFRSLSGAFLCASTEHCEVTVENLRDPGHAAADTRLVIVNPQLMTPAGSGPVRNLDFNSVRLGWYPTALFVALVLATPASFRRRFWTIVAGLVAVHGYALAVLAFSVWNESAAVSLVSRPTGWQPVSDRLQQALLNQLSLAVPVIAWVAMSLRLGVRAKGGPGAATAIPNVD